MVGWGPERMADRYRDETPDAFPRDLLIRFIEQAMSRQSRQVAELVSLNELIQE